MNKQIANGKMDLGRARKVLWQYRNEDIEEFEFIDAVHQLEDRKLDIIKSHVKGLIDGLDKVRAGSEEYERGYARALSDLSILIDQEFNKQSEIASE